tara:strand:- start:1260 stop:1808 length:549 start_codon:yes stop_codon:yes gene_type:complete
MTRPKELHFKDYPDFTPNLSPRQIFSMGSFIDQGGYWRPIYSGVLKKNLSNQHKEFKFFNDVPDNMLINPDKDYKTHNKYGVKSGSSLADWEEKDWIKDQDPYGWVQWYCRFYEGRRSNDDERQIKRWKNFAGPKGRFRRNLINKIKNASKNYDDFSVSPVIRQSLLHWGYELTKKDFENFT